ncbi:MAG: tyrosine-type recombinase/integrase [Sciscionella sp.]
MRGHKRFRAGAWRLVVAAGRDPVTGRRLSIYESVQAPNNRAGAKRADARLAELIAGVEAGDAPEPGGRRTGPTVAELAAAWQEVKRPHRDRRSGEWLGWSPKTAKTVEDNFRSYLLPMIGGYRAEQLTGVELDRVYRHLLSDRGLSPTVVVRCHGQLRAMFNWALRKKLVGSNPAVAADPPRVKPRPLTIPDMRQVREVQQVAPPDVGAFIQLAATVGARRGTLVALRWRDVDLGRGVVTFSRSIAESAHGAVEKGTKADRPYSVAIGHSTASVLEEHRIRAGERALAVGTPLSPDSFVFSDDGGASHWNLAWPSHAWATYSRQAGLTGLRLHDLRHCAASQMQMGGVAPDASFGAVRDRRPPGRTCPACGTVLAAAG